MGDFNPIDVLSVVPGIGSVAANLIGNSQNVKLAREQREHDLRMWSLNNKYNTPQAQKQRLRDAGLNPALSMMNGMMSAGNSQSTAGGQTPAQVDYNPLAEGLRSSVDLFQQRDRQKAEIRNLDANTQTTQIRNKTQLMRDLSDIYKTISETGVNSAHKSYLLKQAHMLEKQIDAFDERNLVEVNKIKQERALMREQEITERVMRSVNKSLVDANIRLSKVQAASFNAQIKATIESINQMKLNGASQREINSFIRDKEREIARQYHLENSNWYNSYKTRIAKEKAETRKSNTQSLFGIPFNIEGSWQIGDAYLP